MIGLGEFGVMVKARRDQLGLTQEQVSAKGGPSDTTMTKIENGDGKPPADLTLRKLDRALSWAPGTARSLLHGEFPLPDGEPLPDVQMGRRRRAAQQARISQDEQESIRMRLKREERVADGIITQAAARISAYHDHKIPSGYVPVSLKSLLLIGEKSDEAQYVTGLPTYIEFEDLEEDEYLDLVEQIETLEGNTLILSGLIDDFLSMGVFVGDMATLQRLKRRIRSLEYHSAKYGMGHLKPSRSALEQQQLQFGDEGPDDGA